jgi:glyoxylase-like metal-dependent hydrolase (beta-lactamase superfamily II)
MESITRQIQRLTFTPFGPFSKQPVHAYVVGMGPEKVLIDSGNGDPVATNLLRKYLTETKGTIQKVLLTHSHINHQAGSKIFLKELQVKATMEPGVVPTHGLRGFPTPGHTKDHIAYYLESEGALFSGDCIKARPSATRYCQCVYTNLDQFQTSLIQMKKLQPRILLQGHGETSWNPMGVLDDALTQLAEIDEILLNIIRAGHRTTKNIFAEFIKIHAIQDSQDLFVIPGTIALHLQKLESKKRIRKFHAFASNESSHPKASTKGPGGLTMHQIFSELQKSRSKDYTNQNHRQEPISMHPLHVDIALDPSSSWQVI